MWKNYLKIALRNLWKNKTHSFINIFGLALGLTGAIVIALWIQRELSVDQFHSNIDRLYRVLEHQTYSNDFVLTVAATPGPLAEALKAEVPEIERATRLSWGERILLTVDQTSFRETGNYADSDFFNLFSFPILHGDTTQELLQPGFITISKKLAEKYFGTTDAVGKSIRVNNEKDYQVSAVFGDVPENSNLKFDFLLPMYEYVQQNDWLKSWNSNGIRAYVLLAKGSDGKVVSDKIVNFLKDHSDQDNAVLQLQSLTDQYLRTDFKDGKYQGGGRIAYVRLFALIALLIIIIACINFMNLATARSANRAKEIGIRRVSGAQQQTLIVQFLGESLIMSLIAGVFAVGMVAFILPFFNRLFNTELSLTLLQTNVWLTCIGITLFTGLVAGIYPAFYLAALRPVEVFKGAATKGGNGVAWLRKGMVVTQFAIATFLIVATLVILTQMNYLKNKTLGYQKENLIYLPVNGTLWDKYDVVKSELLQTPGVQSVSSSVGMIYSWGNNSSNFHWSGKRPDQDILFQTIPVGLDFIETIGAEMAAGRDFSQDFPADSTNFIINQKAAELMELQDPVGQPLAQGEGEDAERGTIIGVVKDFHVNSFHTGQEPVILQLRPWKNFIYLRIRPENVSSTLAQIETVVRKHNPAYPFEYSFVDQEYDQLYRSEQRISALANTFTFLAIFVSCLGLFGLATFTAQQRRKEISIRKVLGASISGITTLLSKEFLWLVAIALLIASPVAWWAMQQWLQSFAYSAGVQWWMFVLAGVLTVAIAFLTVSIQAIRAAVANPIHALKDE